MRAAILIYEGTEPIDLATYGVFSKSLSAADGVKIINMAYSSAARF